MSLAHAPDFPKPIRARSANESMLFLKVVGRSSLLMRTERPREPDSRWSYD